MNFNVLLDPSVRSLKFLSYVTSYEISLIAQNAKITAKLIMVITHTLDVFLVIYGVN